MADRDEAGPKTAGMISDRQLAALRAGMEVQATGAPVGNEWGYSSPLWAQMLLPHTNPTRRTPNLPRWERTNGNVSMAIRPGEWRSPDGSWKSGFPYGVIPRLVLMWAAEQARRTQSRELSLGDSLYSFLGQFDMATGSTDRRRFIEQFRRLAVADMTVTRITDHGTRVEDVMMNVKIAESWRLWWTAKDSADDLPMWDSTITLSPAFFDAVITHGFPIDRRQVDALRARGGGSLSLDIYCWLAYRFHTIRKPTQVSWSQLQAQFSSDYTKPNDFKRNFLKALSPVLAVYPAANVQVNDAADGPGRGRTLKGGLTLYRSATPVPRKAIAE